jgi:hypothetical protein
MTLGLNGDYSLNGIKQLIVVMKYSVPFEVRTDFLNNI